MVKTKQVLILGASGFIGRNLYEYFKGLKSNYTIIAPSRKDLDISDESQVKTFLMDNYYDVILHAAVFNPRVAGYGHVDKELETNLRMYYNFERYQDLFGVMYYFGSGAEFDKSGDILSVSDNYFGNGIPNTDYGFYKYIINRSIFSSSNIVNLRVFGLFGKYENWSKTFISGACCKVLKNLPITIRQNVFFDYMYINDLCEIVEWFVLNTPFHKDYNITSGKRVDLISLAKCVMRVANKEVPMYVCEPGFANEYTANNERLLSELNTFEPTPLEKSISELYSWYQDHSDEINIKSLLYG